MTQELSNNWFLDKESDTKWILHRVRRHLAAFRTRYQAVELLDTYDCGLTLVLDGRVQSSQLDEHIYHEALVHPAMLAHPEPRRVLILGGGEGATLREVLKHPSVRQAVMVDLDRELVEFCKEHLKSWHQGAFEEPRAKLLYQDAFKYLRRPGPKFDVIISDISDPTEGGPAVMAYTREFFQEVRERLSPQGLFVTQATEALMSPHEVLSVIYRTVKSVFEVAECYVEYIPSFVCLWGWVVGSRMHRPSALSAQELSRRIAQRGLKLRFYSPQMQQRLFSLPPYLQGRLRRQRQVATAQEPARVYGGQR